MAVGWAFHKPYWIGRKSRASCARRAEPPLPRSSGNRRTTRRSSAPGCTTRTAAWAPRSCRLPARRCRCSTVACRKSTWRCASGRAVRRQPHGAVRVQRRERAPVPQHASAPTTFRCSSRASRSTRSCLGPDGSVIDDVWIYRLDRERYWMVVNAANNDKDWAWINAVCEGCVCIDERRPWSRALGTETVVVRDLHDPALGGETRGQLALQGPRSLDICCWPCLPYAQIPCASALLDMHRTDNHARGSWPVTICGFHARAIRANRWLLSSSCTRSTGGLVARAACSRQAVRGPADRPGRARQPAHRSRAASLRP